MSNMPSLSQTLRDQYRISCQLSDTMMSKMDLNCLELISSDLTVDDVSPLCSFLLSKEASSSIETIILKSKNTLDRFDSNGNDSMMGNRNGFYKELDLVKTPYFSSKLMNAVVVFISKSINLHSVIVDSVQMPTDFISGLGEALSTSRSIVRWLSFKSCPLGNTGVKILRPHIGRMQLQVLVFEKCGLSDESCSYLSSIIKSQEAMLDTLFWNTTLRSDPLAVSGTAAAKRTQETNRVLSSGLVAISINGNNITKSGIDFIRRAISTNHWFLGLNAANNLIDEDGINLLVRSIRDNNALHALLLGGNPGFTPEAAQCVNQTTSRAPLRLNLMPKGVSMLLRRWMQLQVTEMTGGSASANTSISGPPNPNPDRPSREVQRELRQAGPDFLNDSDSRQNDLSNWDADSSKMSRQVNDQWVRSSDSSYPNGIADEGRGVRSSGDLAYRQENQDPLFGNVQPTREAWRASAPKDSSVNSFKIYLNPQSQTPMSAFLPMSAAPSTPYGAAGDDDISPRYAPSDDFQPYVTKSFADSRSAEAAQNTPNSYYRMKSSAQGANVDRNRSRSPGSRPPVHIPSDWASSSAKGTLDQQLRQLVSTSHGRVGRENDQKNRSRSTQRSSSPSYMARRQANACTRLSQGIASVERVVPTIRARQSPQRRDVRNGDHYQESSERDTDSGRRSTSAMRERYARSPSYRSNGSAASSVQKPNYQSSSPYCESPASRNSGDSGLKKKKKSKKSSREKGIEKDIAREQDKQSVLHQQALDGVILRFADSVKEINRSLGTVSNQLRDVSCSLSASAERASSSSESGSPALKSVTASPAHSASSPIRTKTVVSPKTEISPVRKPSPAKSPVPHHAPISKKEEKEKEKEGGSPEELHGRDSLAQTFGRTRGSLMHHSGAWRGENLLNEQTHDHKQEATADRPHTHTAPISLLSSFMNSQKKAPAHPVKALSPEKVGSHKHGHTHTHGHSHSHHGTSSPVSTYHDRWSARIMSTSASAPPHSSGSNHNGVKKSPTHESVEMSDADIASLIRDRLRKKLKSVLRPTPSSSIASATPLSP